MAGVPIERSPLEPDPKYATKEENNNFNYPTDPGDEGQANCPYSAHIRKTRPRTDIREERREPTRINRTGIPYGPEVGAEEEQTHKTATERGLAFVCYQSDMTKDGFRHIQIDWANIVDFPRHKNVKAGFDPLVGQNNGGPRHTLGKQNGTSLALPYDFIIARGGEYFFTPSIQALKTVFIGEPYPTQPK
ncbi:hypothetical protein FRC12_025137 [Ceratobasidium sp. 428]|nr:hypothetical protein FRC12_025137 [Ceratobasidium sp. 428]